jgi:putative polyhydroxyalkanoate system protein
VKNQTISVSIPHRLTQDEARRRLERGIADLKSKHAKGAAADVQEAWNGNQMTFRVAAMGQSVTGKVDVTPDAVKVDVELPWLLAMIANKIRPQIEQEGRKMLE